MSVVYKMVIGAGLICCMCQAGFADESCQSVFSHVYEQRLWGVNEDHTPSSGWGSLPQFVIPYKQFLVDFMRENQIHSIVDVGCGDWIFSRQIDWSSIQYTGVDVVADVIERNLFQFSAPNITFLHGDLLHMDLPEADLLVCKDVLQHLTNADIHLFLTKLKKFKYCLITNDFFTDAEMVGPENRDIPYRGPHRPLDLTKPPFNVAGIKVLTYPIGAHAKQVLLITP